MRIVDGFFRLLDAFTQFLVFLMASLMILNVAGAVLFRYVLKLPMAWTEELSRYAMIWFGFFGMSLAVKTDDHVSVTFIAGALPAPVRTVLSYLARLLVLFFLVSVVIQSLRHLPMLKHQISTALELPMGIPYLAVTAGSALMILQVVHKLVSGTRAASTEEKPGPAGHPVP